MLLRMYLVILLLYLSHYVYEKLAGKDLIWGGGGKDLVSNIRY